ncbi:ribonuclease HII [Candidatus Kaiserbacteria bacterium]|nr:ribonuclease HII [Candidatus Kaiserbacteria bacterium]
MRRYIVGIDEVGRGPLAGPVSIGIVVCKTLLVIPELTDSKKMTEAARKRASALAGGMQKEGSITFGIYSASAHEIDSCGIELAIKRIIRKGLSELAPEPSNVEVVLDGRLRAPEEYRQQTVIGGDSLIPAISLAAVVAKVARDRYMATTAAQRFPAYGFERHKGYGTAEHVSALRKVGPSAIHRMTYLSRITDVSMPA